MGYVANHAGAGLTGRTVPFVAKSIEMALNSTVGQTVRKMFNVDGKAKGQSLVNKAFVQNGGHALRARRAD